MPTQKLFYEDCHLREFAANVTDCRPAEGGYAVILDHTAFYPEGGGQACDLGTLNGIAVLDVREHGEEIVHLCESPLDVGAKVKGVIDWTRRFDLMQQHTGEHILSGLIHQAFGYHNSGFHVGKDVMEVDFDGPISYEAIQDLERKANEIIWQNLPVLCSVPDPETLSALFYRTKRELPWPVRIVEIPGCDSCACCGVHVAYTGEVGLIKILSCVKLRQGVRLEMVCGGRAYDYMRRIFEENRQVSQCFSANILETGSAAAKMNEALAQEKYRSAGLQTQIFEYIVKDNAGKENVLLFKDNLTSAQLRQLAELLCAQRGGFVAVFSGEDGAYSYCLASQNQDVSTLGRAMTQALNGRGGGKPQFQQGSLRATQREIAAFFEGL